jgi:hypothetical protein
MGPVNSELRFWFHPLAPEMTFCEDVARTAFQVFFEMLSLVNRLERDIYLDLPWQKLGGIGTLAGVMLNDSPTEVRSMTNVPLVRMTQALDYVCVEHVMARHP